VWPKTRNELIATPVIYEDRVYIANGQDPEHGEGVGHLCHRRNQARRYHQERLVWQHDKIRRSISTVSIADGLPLRSRFHGFRTVST
jgi:hypothetical protein